MLTEYESETIDTYSRQALDWYQHHNTPRYWVYELDVLQSLISRGSHILEIGAGAGRDAQCLIDRGFQYTGIDACFELLDLACQLVPGGNFFHQTVYDLAHWDQDIFDAFWSVATLLHIPKNRIEEALQAIRVPLKAGAIGFIAVKWGQGERMEQCKDTQNQRLFVYYHLDELERILRLNGYRIIYRVLRPISDTTIWLEFFVTKV